MTRESHFFNHEDSHLPDIRVVSFDVWMTLIRSHPEYKRERARVMGSALNFSGDLTEVTAQTVSYTHLDVYKRQVFMCLVFSSHTFYCTTEATRIG